MIKSVEVIVADPEDVYFQGNWVPSHGLEKAIKARAEGKVVVISVCDCGCWKDNTTERTEALIRKTFGNDPLVALGHSGLKGRRVMLTQEGERLGFNSLARSY